MSERRSAPSHSIPALFVFMLLGLFAMFSLILIMFGAQAYHKTVERTAQNNAQRVISSYIRNNLRTADNQGCIQIEEDSDISRLVIIDPEDSDYAKYIFVYEGELCELYTETESEFNPEAGEVICPADSFRVSVNDGTISIMIESEGTEYVTVFAPHCEVDRT